MSETKEFESMTLNSVYRKGRELLEKSGIQDADFDSLYLLEYFFKADRTALILHGEKSADSSICEKFFSAISERASGKPLQYIVGKWNFMGFDFYVGEGVLIPRDDTEIVVEVACDYLEKLIKQENIKKPKIIDLCSGSGAIAVTLAKIFPNSEVTALEYSDNAIEYLKRNIKLNGAENVRVYKGDVTACSDDFSNESFDLVISNPPYIETEEIDTLQTELRFEPRMALDGGSDGLYFYRIITEKWASKVKFGGMLAYEVGEDQFEPVSIMVEKQGYTDVTYRLDLQNFKRTVSGIRIYKEQK